MLNIPRLRNVLKKLETSSDLAKFLIQRATAVAGTINKEYAVFENPSNVLVTPSSSSSGQHVTSLSKSLPPPTASTTMPTHTFAKKQQNSSTESDSMYNSEQKTISAAIATVSLFSSIESNGGAAEVIAGGNSNLRGQTSVLQNNYRNQNQNHGNDNKAGADKQRSFQMSDAKVKEVTQQACGEAAIPKHDMQDDQESSHCNGGASCGSGSGGSAQEKTCFKSGLGDILHFMELVGSLKHTKRTGWVLRDVNDCESISGHMYRMSMMTFLLDGSEGLSQIRCMELALVHDLAESLVGDLTPFCGVAKEEKKAMELKAMEDICKLIEPRGKRIMELFEEYEAGQSAESKFVKDLDRLDMVMQAFEYEKRDNCLMKHQEFFDSTEGKFQHPFVKKLVKEICDQRKALVEAKIVANGNFKLKTVTPNCPPCLEHKNERS